MEILVTGATGFVGSAVLRLLLQEGHSVRALAREGSDRRNLDDLPVKIVTGDLNDRASLDAALDGSQALYHVAADYRLWVPKPEEIYQNNVEGTRSIMLAAAQAGVERIVYTSSVAALGHNADGPPADESTPASIDQMIGHYKRSKFLAEEVVRKMAEEDGLPVVIVNPSTPVGPRDIKPTPTGRLIQDAVRGKMPAYVDTGLNIVHVDDVAAGHLLAFKKGQIGERYILGSENMTLREILGEIARLAGRPPPRIRLPHNLVLPAAYAMETWARITGSYQPQATVDSVRMSKKKMFFSIEKARQQLGYSPRSAKKALASAVQWFQEQSS